MTQTELASRAGLGLSTVVDFERERRSVSEQARDSLRAALENSGVDFIAENGGGVGVRLRKPSGRKSS
jgi:transcriptional regulator with XRE-family HTH domain